MGGMDQGLSTPERRCDFGYGSGPGAFLLDAESVVFPPLIVVFRRGFPKGSSVESGVRGALG